MRRSPFGWDYQPGVTGSEPEITGESLEAGDKCPSCFGKLMDDGTGENVICSRCGDEWPTS